MSAIIISLAAPASAALPSESHRMAALATIWAEARFAFPFWDQVPDLDWDEAFREYIPKVASAQDEIDYYRTLQRFVALLRDGHSNVFPPPGAMQGLDRPPLGLDWIEDQVVVVWAAAVPEIIKAGIEVGDRILEADGRDAVEYMRD
jgi:hypothetical protein